jgi:hypothetical protein
VFQAVGVPPGHILDRAMDQQARVAGAPPSPNRCEVVRAEQIDVGISPASTWRAPTTVSGRSCSMAPAGE